MENNAEIVRTTCGLCQIGCGVCAHVSGGRILKVEGDPENPLNRGTLCPKGMASLEYLYHPDRLREPLIRTGARGEGKWRGATWEEALDIVSGRLEETRQRYGAESAAFIRGAAKGLQDDYMTRFANAFGSPNISSMAHVCFIPRRVASLLTYGFYAIPDLDHLPACIVVWGVNASDTLFHVYLRIKEAVRNGATLVVIDPQESPLAREAHLWVKVKPGSDLLLGLAMLNVIITEGLYDRSFVEGCTTGFDELRRYLAPFTAETVSPETRVPAGVITELARLYSTKGPASIQWGNGIDHSEENFQTARAICILRAVTGNLGRPGGDVQWVGPPILPRGTPEFSLHEMISPELRKRRTGGERGLLPTLFYALPQDLYTAMETGRPYPVRSCYVQGCNPLLTYPNPRRVFGAFQDLDFLAVADMFLTPTAMLADVVLPVTTYLEFDSIVSPPYSLAVATVQQQVVRIPGCRSDYEILKGLAGRLGFDQLFWATEQEALDQVLAPAGITFDEFREMAVLKGTRRVDHAEKGFPTPSGKVELYSERLKEWGFDPLPTPSRAESREERETYPLVLTSGKVAPYRHSGGRQIPSLRALHPEPVAIIHPETAKGLGINDGDRIRIETKNGGIVQRAVFNGEVDPLSVAVDFAWWFPERGEATLFGWEEANLNMLIGDDPPYGRELGTPNLRGIPCRIAKAGA
jgi:anaerobic selenocysteine-containing dehydrogenase